MKIKRKDAIAVVRSYLSMIFYQKVCNYFSYGTVLPYIAAKRFHNEPLPQSEPDFSVDDLLEFLDLQRHRTKGTFIPFAQDEIMLRYDYMRNLSGFHIFLSISYFDLTADAAERTISFIGHTPDSGNVVDYIKFSINESYKFLPKDDKLDIMLGNKDIQLIWKEVTSNYAYFHKMIGRTKYYV